VAYENWLTLKEAVELTGISESTFQRMIRKHEIQREYRAQPGRKDVVVLDPVKVRELQTKPRHPVPDPQPTALVPKPVTDPVKVSVPSTVSASDMMELLTALRRPQLRLAEKLLLTTEEAAVFSGLSTYELRKAVREQRLPEIKRKGYLFRPVDLRRYVDGLIEGVKGFNAVKSISGVTAAGENHSSSNTTNSAADD
jgi:excisionase family DNA binding protein